MPFLMIRHVGKWEWERKQSRGRFVGKIRSEGALGDKLAADECVLDEEGWLTTAEQER